MVFSRFLRLTTEHAHSQTSSLLSRIERLEAEHARLSAQLDAERQLLRLGSNITAAAHAAPTIGAAIESFAQGLRAPVKRGRAGGKARAAQVRALDERYSDGRFMSHREWEEVERQVAGEEYMRYAAGGFARARMARRAPDGTYLPREREPDLPDGHGP